MSANPPTVGQELATAPVAPGFAKASSALSEFLGLSPSTMVSVLKAQCFKCHPDQVTDGQLAAFVVVANEMKVNPLLPGMLYAFPVQGGGIVPMMGPDGVYKKLAEHPDVDSYEVEIFPEDVTKVPTHATCSIWRKGRERPLKYTALLSEWKIGNNPNWNSRPRHMLTIRAIKQCARQVIHGIPFDEDERQIMGEMNVTNTAGEGDAAGAPPTRAPAPKKEKKGAAAVVENTEKEAPKTNGKASNVIEGEFTEVTRAAAAATPAPAEAPPEAKKETPPPAEEKKAETPAPEAAPAEKKPRAFLQDGEAIEATCTVKSVTPMFVTAGGVRTGSVSAAVEGDFNGNVLHVGGATPEGTALIPLPAWEAGKVVKLSLIGKLNKTSKQVMTRVEKVEEASAEMSVD